MPSPWIESTDTSNAILCVVVWYCYLPFKSIFGLQTLHILGYSDSLDMFALGKLISCANVDVSVSRQYLATAPMGDYCRTAMWTVRPPAM